MMQRKRRVRKPILVVGILLLVVVSFFIVKLVVSVFSGSGPLAITENSVYTISDKESVKFNLDYTNNKKLNKIVEEELSNIYLDNSNVFDNKEKDLQVIATINSDENFASYVIIDKDENINELYGVINVDLKRNQVIDHTDLYVEDLKGLSMLVRENLAKDSTLSGNKNVYTKTLPEKDSFKYITFEDDGINFYFTKELLDANSYSSVMLNYEDVKPYLSDSVLKVVDSEYVRPEAINVRYIDPTKPMVAITFDDGPTTSTSVDVANYFDSKDSRLTFFWLGSRIENNKEIVKNISDEGHEIANHSYDHSNFNSLSDDELMRQTEGVNKMIQEITNQDRVLIRAPYGAANADVRSKVKSPLIMWGVDTNDWQSRNQEAVYNHMSEYVYDGSVVLLHDLYETSVSAAKQFLDANVDKYQFVTVSELFNYRGIPLEDGKFYFDTLGR